MNREEVLPHLIKAISRRFPSADGARREPPSRGDATPPRDGEVTSKLVRHAVGEVVGISYGDAAQRLELDDAPAAEFGDGAAQGFDRDADVAGDVVARHGQGDGGVVLAGRAPRLRLDMEIR